MRLMNTEAGRISPRAGGPSPAGRKPVNLGPALGSIWGGLDADEILSLTRGDTAP
jgi:hypothetical protein